MPGQDNNNIPSINIITDVLPPLSATSSLPSPAWSPASGLLPLTIAYGQSSPTVSDAGSIPPSPTLSSHSVTPYKSTVQLRDNIPDQNSGLTSTGLLNPSFHNRKLSNATFVTETESNPRHVSSARTSLIHVDRPNSEKIFLDAGSKHKGKDEKKKKKKGESDEDEEPTQTNHQLELAQDEAIDPKPFQFKPYQLAHMLDPKSLVALVTMGGVRGLLRGLGTDVERGLSTEDTSTRVHEKHGLGSGTSYEKPSEVVLTKSSGNIGTPTDDQSAFTASFDDRKRVYGKNILPTRSNKTLLQLIWAAMKDEVLILLSIATVVSLALGFFKGFGTPRVDDEPPVDWVEGIAIMIATAIVVIVGSLNDWQKERQFEALNERKEERRVKVIRDGLEKIVDIKEVVVGDIALLESGEIVPIDGIFTSGHHIKCDESGATGEPDSIKKASCDSLSQLGALRLLLSPIPSSEYDVEKATRTPLQGSRNGHALETEITNHSLEMLDKDSPPIMPTATASTSHISGTTTPPYSQFNDLAIMSHAPPVYEEGMTGSRPNERPTTTTTVPWHSRTLSPFTLYGELSVACTPEEFALLRSRLQQEWSFDGGFLVGIAAVNAAILAITTDSIFKIDSSAYIAVATSSSACGLGIVCDVWFLLRYNWVDLQTFIYRSRDVYGSYVSFSLSSRMPTFCVVVSSISLMSFLGRVAFDASPVSVLVIGVLVVLVMTIQFIVYGAHRFATSSLHVWRAGAISMLNAVKRLRSFLRG